MMDSIYSPIVVGIITLEYLQLLGFCVQYRTSLIEKLGENVREQSRTEWEDCCLTITVLIVIPDLEDWLPAGVGLRLLTRFIISCKHLSMQALIRGIPAVILLYGSYI